MKNFAIPGQNAHVTLLRKWHTDKPQANHIVKSDI
jgi:hypothetical protein